MKDPDLTPVHPGEILKADFLGAAGITEYRLATDIGVQQSRIAAIVKGKRAITPDTALRLAKYFGTSPELWLSLQSHYELLIEEQRIAGDLAAIHRSEKMPA
jgi:addiction module HigA family antidote